MDEITINPHSFEMAKKSIKNFSQKKADDFKIEEVEIGGAIFGWGNHRVTGSELNERMGSVQNNMIAMNDSINKTIKEFSQVYNALESLDKDYIQGILLSIKATEETSKKVQKTQQDLKKVVDNQKKTLENLKRFKEKLDQYTHLKDVDQLWKDLQNWQEDIVDLSEQIERCKKEINRVVKNNDELKQFEQKLKNNKHIYDIDKMWNSCEKFQKDMGELSEKLVRYKKDVDRIGKSTDELKQFEQKLKKNEHLYDIDQLWQECINSNKRVEINTMAVKDTVKKYEMLNENVDSLNECVNTVESLVKKQSSNFEGIKDQNNELLEMIKTNEKNSMDAFANMRKKIRYSYMIAGGSAGIAIVELILIIIGVI